MRYYRCKCGKREAWSSHGVRSCNGCRECNTTLEEAPGLHTAPEQHELIKQFDQNTGAPARPICLNCCRDFSSEDAQKEVEAGRAKWSEAKPIERVNNRS